MACFYHNPFKANSHWFFMDNYNQLLERISNSSNLSVEELERKVEAKRAKLSGLVSREGAAQIVAAELGINFEKERMKISELVQGMKRANVLAKVLNASPVRGFNKNGREGKVANLLIADESSNIKLILWDTHHIALVEDGTISEGCVIEISNGSIRNGEIHLSAFGDIKLSKEKLENVITNKISQAINFKEVKAGQTFKSRAVIVQTFEPRYFEVCPECGKKAVDAKCAIHGTISPRKRALLNLVLDDGTETLRAVLFGEQILKLGLSESEIFSLEQFALKKDTLLGEEKVFSGNIRQNALYNTLEFTVDGVEDIDAQILLEELQSKS